MPVVMHWGERSQFHRLPERFKKDVRDRGGGFFLCGLTSSLNDILKFLCCLGEYCLKRSFPSHPYQNMETLLAFNSLRLESDASHPLDYN